MYCHVAATTSCGVCALPSRPVWRPRSPSSWGVLHDGRPRDDVKGGWTQALKKSAVHAWGRKVKAQAQGAAAASNQGSPSPSSSPLSTDRKAYHQVNTENAEFLVSTNSAGELDFSEVFVKKVGDAEFSPCQVDGAAHRGFFRYQAMPWMSIKSSDIMKGKLEEIRVTHKVVFLRVKSQKPYRLSFEHALMADGEQGAVLSPPIEWADDPTSMKEPILRITKDQLLVVDAAKRPDPEQVVKGFILGQRPEDVLFDLPEIDEVDAMAQGLDEPDVPSVDLV